MLMFACKELSPTLRIKNLRNEEILYNTYYPLMWMLLQSE